LFLKGSSSDGADLILNVSLKRSNALGRGSTTLADATTRNKPSNPRTCQSGKEEREGSGVFSGIGVIKNGVADGSICVGLGVCVADGV